MKENISIEEMTKDELYYVDEKLEEYNSSFSGYEKDHHKNQFFYSIKIDGEIVAGIIASFTCFDIVYISTLWVSEEFRKKGYGRILVDKVINEARENGANLIRVDTFSFQGEEFYQKIGFERIGNYQNDNYQESFYIKRL